MLTYNLAVIQTQDSVPGVPPPGWTRKEGRLVVVFDVSRSSGEPSATMKIKQGTQLLYDIPLQQLITSTRAIINNLERQGIEVSSEIARLPISGMARSPQLAIQYQPPGTNQVRRVQLRFASPHDFDSAYDHVRELGLWFLQSRARSEIPKSQDQQGGGSQSSSRLSETNSRPGTALPFTSAPPHAQLNEMSGIRPSTLSFLRPDSSTSPRVPDPVTTTSVTLSHGREIDDGLPPRRELPFERPDSATSSGSRPYSAMMGPPTLPASARSTSSRPTSSRAGRKTPKSKTANSHGKDLSPLPEPTYISKLPVPKVNSNLNIGTTEMNRPYSAVTPNDYAMMKGVVNAPPALPPSSPRPASSYNIPLAQRSAFVPTPPASEANILNSDINDDLQYDPEALAAYAQLPSDVRRDQLDAFLLAHLEDENFLSLVDEMQMNVTRIGK